jgi:hypothetical protein
MIRLLLFIIATSVALSAGHADTSIAKDDDGEVEVRFANGSLVRMTLVQDKIDIETLYGKLSVPLRDIRRIEFGLHVPEGMDKKVDAAIKQLGSGEYKGREGAVRELTVLGVYAYPAVLKAAKSADLEVAKRATDILARIRARVPATELRLGEDDRVVTGKFTIVGRIVTPTIKARTEYFGDTRLSLHQLRHFRALALAKDAEVTIDAANFASANQWLETGISVDTASALLITATGQVELAPQQPGTYICGPLGYGPRPAGGPGGGLGGFGGKKGGAGFLRVYPGMLMGRIGENGNVFPIGDRFEGAAGDGKLYLHINPSTYDTASSGAYRVRISIKN